MKTFAQVLIMACWLGANMSCRQELKLTSQEKEDLERRFSDSLVRAQPRWDSACNARETGLLPSYTDSVMRVRVREIQEKLATKPR